MQNSTLFESPLCKEFIFIFSKQAPFFPLFSNLFMEFQAFSSSLKGFSIYFALRMKRKVHTL
jgi:hypothetical protein